MRLTTREIVCFVWIWVVYLDSSKFTTSFTTLFFSLVFFFQQICIFYCYSHCHPLGQVWTVTVQPLWLYLRDMSDVPMFHPLPIHPSIHSHKILHIIISAASSCSTWNNRERGCLSSRLPTTQSPAVCSLCKKHLFLGNIFQKPFFCIGLPVFRILFVWLWSVLSTHTFNFTFRTWNASTEFTLIRV